MAKEYDKFRDSWLRYLGYANEIGEAFRPLAPRFVPASYAIATGYVMCDVLDKSAREYKYTDNLTKTAVIAGDVFIWQMLASVVIPGFTINRITHCSALMLRQQKKMPKNLKLYIPTLLGLASIPLIITPIDHGVEYVMEKTYRKIFQSSKTSKT